MVRSRVTVSVSYGLQLWTGPDLRLDHFKSSPKIEADLESCLWSRVDVILNSYAILCNKSTCSQLADMTVSWTSQLDIFEFLNIALSLIYSRFSVTYFGELISLWVDQYTTWPTASWFVDELHSYQYATGTSEWPAVRQEVINLHWLTSLHGHQMYMVCFEEKSIKKLKKKSITSLVCIAACIFTATNLLHITRNISLISKFNINAVSANTMTFSFWK